MTSPTTSLDYTRQIQTNEEATPGSITQDATWKNIGIGARFTQTAGTEHEEIPLLGKEDIHSDEVLFYNHTFSLTWYIFDTRFLRYCTELRGGSGTIDKTNTIMQTMLISGVQKTRLYKGTICDRISLEIGRVIKVTGTFKCMTVTNWLTDAEVLTACGAAWTPAGAITSTPWTHRSGGTTTPFTYGASTRDLKMMTLEISRNPAPKEPLGNTVPTYIRAGGRRINGSISLYAEDVGPLDDLLGNTPRNLIFRLHTTPVDLTATNAKFNDYQMDTDASSNELVDEVLQFVAPSCTVTALTVAT